MPEEPPKSHAHTSRTRFFAPFWHTTTVALHSTNRFSTVPNIIPASQVLSKNTTAGFGQGFPKRVSAEQPLLPSEISRNANGWPPWFLSWWACLWAFSGTTVSPTWVMPTAWENCRGCKQEQTTEAESDYRLSSILSKSCLFVTDYLRNRDWYISFHPDT